MAMQYFTYAVLFFVPLLCLVLQYGQAKKFDGEMKTPGNAAIGKTNPSDRAVLDYLYYNATTDTTHRLSNWTGWENGTSDPCMDYWYGITCVEVNSVYYVSGINLKGHYLQSLPSKISTLKYLQSLDVSLNYFRPSFPQELFEMQSLENLDISRTYEFGHNHTLPKELNLPNLQVLNADHSGFVGPLPVTWNTPKLESIILSFNQLTGQLPTDIGKITGLKQLMLDNNQLFGNFPASYGDLHQLTNLSLVQSPNSEYYSRLCPFLPSTWETLFSLQYVSICAYGNIPDYIGTTWLELRSLIINSGHLEGNLSANLCKLINLEELDLSYNRLTGPIPECIFTIPNLAHLDLSNNIFSGHISEAIGELKNINYLALSYNHFNSTLPLGIGKLTTATEIRLEYNNLIGELPSEYDTLRNTDHRINLYLNNNMLSSIGDGLGEDFFRSIDCSMSNNPFQCPLPSYVYDASCSTCNTGSKHSDCQQCIGDTGCGWCSYGPNCVTGSHQGPTNEFSCPGENWSFDTCRAE